MSDDILTRIDEVVAAATSCFCGCGTVLKARNPSLWFASEECQARWGERRLTAGEKPRESALVAATPVHPASPWLTFEDLTGRDRVAQAFRREVVRQGLDPGSIEDHYQPLGAAAVDAERDRFIRRLEEELARRATLAPPARRPWWKRWLP